DPAFFLALRHHLTRISGVHVEPKRGRYRNELTKFRYDVTLRLDSQRSKPATFLWLDWRKDRLSLPSLQDLLREQKPVKLGIANIPNVRVTREIKTWELLANSDGRETVADLRNQLA